MPPTTIPTRRPASGCGASKPCPKKADAGAGPEQAGTGDRSLTALRCGPSLRRQGRQRFVLEAVGTPVRHLNQADAFVEGARRIPVQDREIDTQEAARLGDRRDLRQQPASDVAAARPFADEDVLDIDAGTALQGGVVVEEERKARRAATDVHQQAFEALLWPEAV